MSRIDTHAPTTEIDAQVQRPELCSERCGVRDDADEIDGIIYSNAGKISKTSGYPRKKRKTQDTKPPGRRVVGPLAPSLLKFDRNNLIFILANWASDKRRKIQNKNQRTYEQEHVLQ
jgi:hypothetical protein